MSKPRCHVCNHWLTRAEAEGTHHLDLRCHRCQGQVVQRLVAEATPTEILYYKALLSDWVEGLIDARVSELTIN